MRFQETEINQEPLSFQVSLPSCESTVSNLVSIRDRVTIPCNSVADCSQAHQRMPTQNAILTLYLNRHGKGGKHLFRPGNLQTLLVCLFAFSSNSCLEHLQNGPFYQSCPDFPFSLIVQIRKRSRCRVTSFGDKLHLHGVVPAGDPELHWDCTQVHHE